MKICESSSQGDLLGIVYGLRLVGQGEVRVIDYVEVLRLGDCKDVCVVD